MQHVAEIAVHSFLRDVLDGKASMSEDVIDKVAEDVIVAIVGSVVEDSPEEA